MIIFPGMRSTDIFAFFVRFVMFYHRVCRRLSLFSISSKTCPASLRTLLLLIISIKLASFASGTANSGRSFLDCTCNPTISDDTHFLLYILYTDEKRQIKKNIIATLIVFLVALAGLFDNASGSAPRSPWPWSPPSSPDRPLVSTLSIVIPAIARSNTNIIVL